MKQMRNFFIVALLFIGAFSAKNVQAHCEIPCGIYNDSVRIVLMYEHISTIEKSMKMIVQLEAEETVDYNQLVRWVVNKEEHAKKLQDVMEQYFMHQRIKLADETNKEAYSRYVDQLTLAHKITVYAMKAKQGTDEVYIKKLRETVHLFEHAYFE